MRIFEIRSCIIDGANAIFGFLGGAISLLFWLYLMAMGLLLGAEVNSLLAVDRGLDLNAPAARTKGAEDPPVESDS